MLPGEMGNEGVAARPAPLVSHGNISRTDSPGSAPPFLVNISAPSFWWKGAAGEY